MKVRDLKLMLAELDDEEEVGYADGNGGYVVAQTAEYTADSHDPGCHCGCVGICLR